MRARGAVACFCLILCGASLLDRGAQAQSSDNVNVVPRNRPAAASNQSPEPLGGNSLRPVRIDVDLVLVPASVTDRMNRPVIDLQKDNFGLYENDALQQIRYFTEEDEPISIGLILDVSKSMSNKIETERAAVAEFFKNANPEDDYFVISLDNRPHLIADTTQSLEDIQQKLALVVPDGNTALLDAIYLGVAKMRSARYQRRALLIISDGGDNHSHYTTRETKSMVQESDVLVYSIGIFDNLPVPVFKTIEEKLGQRLLVDITEASGGRTIAADHREKVPEIAAAISRELRQQYVLGYKSSSAVRDGKWRKIKVQVSAASGDPPLRAYYKRGYLAPEK
jgi:Ca-activated chloride channel family protein